MCKLTTRATTVVFERNIPLYNALTARAQEAQRAYLLLASFGYMEAAWAEHSESQRLFAQASAVCGPYNLD